MEKIDTMLAKLWALEVMVAALAVAAPDREYLKAQFDLATARMQSLLLRTPATEEFVDQFLADLKELRTLVASAA